MIYPVHFKPKALKDGRVIPKKDLENIFDRIEYMKHDLRGDVKRLAKFTTEYRLRIGNYRVLFEVENNEIIIYRIIHRKEAYK